MAHHHSSSAPPHCGLWVESTAAIEEDEAAAPDAYRLVRPCPPKESARTKSGKGGVDGDAGECVRVGGGGGSARRAPMPAAGTVARRARGAAAARARSRRVMRSSGRDARWPGRRGRRRRRARCAALNRLLPPPSPASLLASYPALLPGETDAWRAARAAAADAVPAALLERAGAAVAAADGPAFTAVARFVLDAVERRPPPPPNRPPDNDRLPVALATAGGVNPVDHVAAVRRLAAGLRAAGVRVALLAPRDVDSRGGVARAMNAALRQLIDPGTDADDLAALVTWHADESHAATAAAAAAAAAVRAAAVSGRSARSARGALAQAGAVAGQASVTSFFPPASARAVAAPGPPPVAFVVESLEACDPYVLGDLLKTLRFAHAAERLPVAAVLGVATSAAFAQAALPPPARAGLAATRFALTRTAHRAEAALTAAFAAGSFPGALLSGPAASAVDDRFTGVDFTAAGLARALDAHLAEHARGAVLAPFGAALAGVGAHQRVEGALAAAPGPVLAALGAELGIAGTPGSAAFAKAATVALISLRSSWSLWATALRWLHAAAGAAGGSCAADGLSMRELLRDASDAQFWGRGGGRDRVATLAARVRAGGAPLARAVLVALADAAAAIDGGVDEVEDELAEADRLLDGLGGRESEAAEEAAPAPAAPTTTSTTPAPRPKSGAGRRAALADGAAAASIAAAAAPAHPGAAAAAALLTSLAERALSTPPAHRPGAAPVRVDAPSRVARSLTGAPRAAVHRALTDPGAYLGLRAAGAASTTTSLPPAKTCGDDDAVLLHRLLLQCDETSDARELLARFAALHGWAPAAGDAPAAAPAGPALKRRKKGGGVVGAAAPVLGPRAPSAPAAPTRPPPGATPVAEVLARYQRALAELQMVGLVGRARRRGQVRRACFPPGCAQ